MDDTQHQADAHDAAQPLTQSEYEALPGHLTDHFEAWLQSGDEGAGMLRELIAKDTSDHGIVRRAACLAFYHGRVDGVQFAHGNKGATWQVRP